MPTQGKAGASRIVDRTVGPSLSGLGDTGHPKLTAGAALSWHCSVQGYKASFRRIDQRYPGKYPQMTRDLSSHIVEPLFKQLPSLAHP